ncbi:HNH/endonuclease VII fold toxin-2 domain-containing protein [Pseudomonas sp. TE3786]
MALAGASEQCKADSKKTQDCMEKHTKQNTHQQKRKDNKLDPANTTHEHALKHDSKVDWAKIVKDDDGKGEFYNKAGTLKTMCADDKCGPLLECNLVPFDFGCCDGKTPHHIVPAHCFLPSGERKSGAGDRYPGTDKYDDTKAPCVCLTGATKIASNADGSLKEHGLVHAIVDDAEDAFMHTEKLSTPGGKPKMKAGVQAERKTAGTWSFEQANDAGADAVAKVKQKCDKECLKAQSEAAHKHMGLDVGKGKSDKLMLRADSLGSRTPPGFVPKGAVSAPAGAF